MRLGGKAWTWLFFVPCTVAAILFSIISLITFGDLAQVQFDDAAGHLGSELNGALAATFMAPVLTTGVVLMSFFVLVKKSWTSSGSGFSYAFVTAWFMMNAMFLLLTGVVLSGAKHHTNTFEQSPQWSTSATNAFTATEVLAFITAAFQLVVGVALVSNRRSFGQAQLTVDELGLSDRLRSPPSDSGGLSPPAGYPAAPTTQMSAVPATRGAWNTEV